MKHRFAILLIATLVTGPASAILVGEKELKVAIPVNGSPSAKPVADIYYLVGEVGAKETYNLKVKGDASITLFGPDGSEILTSTGVGTVKLEAVMPFSDVFTLAIARAMPGQAYTLTRSTTVPTITEAALAHEVGYAAEGSPTCWLTVGVKKRATQSDSGGERKTEYTLSADRSSVDFLSTANGSAFAGKFSVEYDGSQMHRVFRFQNGKVFEDTLPFTPTFDAARSGVRSSYLCDH